MIYDTVMAFQPSVVAVDPISNLTFEHDDSEVKPTLKRLIDFMKKDLQRIFNSAASAIRPACDANNHELTVTIPDEPILLDADATRLEQLLVNLLGNACKYSGEGCHIGLKVELVPAEAPEGVVIHISDDGIGIDPELLPRIFDLFVQSSRTLDRAQGGLGIGLTIVHRLVICTAAASRPTAKAMEVERKSPCTCQSSPVPLPPRPSRLRPPRRSGRCACSSWMTTGTPPKAWRCSRKSAATPRASPTPGRTPSPRRRSSCRLRERFPK